ncbi:hypothetical protein FDP41_009258 [Naegleria fowleri]|uniref:TLDc domain-containing protein n=1 Tax=Naegleria fowleri TaxID=5763 RepID=A0A6A5BE48_NAEFO|nr:uncharacterized protein FDP41_009258 [Naegleria fowleri]KAF0972355.1 hypothetical protein FDP41_009258 [Naegleria fowleri]
MAPNEVSLTMPIPDNVSAPTQNIQAQRKRPIKMIVVKYFEDTDKYAKIVPRPAFHILRRRLEEESQKGSSTPPRPPTKEEAENLAIVFGKDLTGMIMRDQADWLATYNPITSIMLYNEKQNKFETVTDTMEFGCTEQENVYTFHVKRKVGVEHCLAQSTMTFSSIGGAETWLETAFTRVNRNVIIRYHDVLHHGYTRLYKGERIPPGRTGKSMVKLLIENILPAAIENQDSILTKKLPTENEDGFIDEEHEDAFNFFEGGAGEEKGPYIDLKNENALVVGKEDKDEHVFVNKEELQCLHISRFADVNKIPVHLLYNENQRQNEGPWKDVTKFPLSMSEVSKSTKSWIRSGIPQSKRCLLWMGITGSASLLKQSPYFYENHFEKTYGHYNSDNKTFKNKKEFIESIDPRIIAEFGGKLPGYNADNPTAIVQKEQPVEVQDDEKVKRIELDKDYCLLTHEGVKAAKRILCVLADHHIDIDYCPPIPDLVQILLIIMNEKQTYATVHCMLEKSRESKWYFRTNKMQHALFIESFSDIIKKNIPNLASHFEKIGFDISSVTYKWFSRLFVPYLPFDFVLRALDSFFNEGAKILYRVAYAILKTLEPKLLKVLSPNYMEDILTSNNSITVDEEEFFKTAFKFGISRKYLTQLDEKNRSEINPNKLSSKITTFTKPKIGSTSEIIKDESQWELLVSWLSYKQRLRTLSLRFTTSRDGYSLSQLYNMCSDIGPNIILISAVPISLDGDIDDIKKHQKDKMEDLIPQELEISENEQDAMKVIEMIRKHKEQGASLRKSLKRESKKTESAPVEKKKTADVCIFGAFCGDSYDKTYRFEGTTDTFLFSMYPVEAKYKWSRKNDFFVMGRKDRLVFGAGGDGPALQIDDQLCIGTSNRCTTFDNEPLAGSKTTFSILKLEVWYFK